jgi:hypothetical protein
MSSPTVEVTPGDTARASRQGGSSTGASRHGGSATEARRRGGASRPRGGFFHGKVAIKETT